MVMRPGLGPGEFSADYAACRREAGPAGEAACENHAASVAPFRARIHQECPSLSVKAIAQIDMKEHGAGGVGNLKAPVGPVAL
jgi:hypothetical protein